MRLWPACALLWIVGGCAATGSSVAVQGSDVDVSVLAGKWEGTYEGTDSGRQGTITFDLFAGYRLAEGKVMMNAGGDPANAKPLQIQFVQVGGKQLSGKIEQYTDPQCSCAVQTEFVGEVHGNVIGGTFITHAVGSTKNQSGRWTANRK
jgi:hypothetical protein